MNDIFSLTINFGMGKKEKLVLAIAAWAMNLCGTAQRNVYAVKKAFDQLGCGYRFGCDDNYLKLTIEGIEPNLQAALKLTNEHITSPRLEKDQLKAIYEKEKGARMVFMQPADIAKMLAYYVGVGV
jgi:hypothetical protein